MAKKETTYDDILKDLKQRNYSPLYFLMGEEPFFIDKISDYIIDNVLTETEKEFNLTVLYGADTTMSTVITAARRYPMMSDYQVVVVKEAQALSNIEELAVYLKNPMKSTILVMCYKHGTLDRRKKWTADIEQVAVLFESKKIKEGQLPAFITTYLKQKGIDIEQKATAMLADFVGNDLNRLAGELEKLIITLPTGQTRIVPDSVERNIGVSKEYNNFELRNAIVSRDILKANKIIKYFEDNPKTNPIQPTLAVLYGFFSNLMLAYYAPDKSPQGVATMLGLKTPWQAQEYIKGMQQFQGVKTMQIIGEIRYADAKSKGVDYIKSSDGDILRELVFTILH